MYNYFGAQGSNYGHCTRFYYCHLPWVLFLFPRLEETEYNRGMSKQDQYDEMRAKYIAGQITAELWMEFCTEVLSEILDQPEVKAVMIRLKNR